MTVKFESLYYREITDRKEYFQNFPNKKTDYAIILAMKLPERLGFRIYFFFIAWVSIGDFAVLLLPETESYMYYHTMQTLLPSAIMFYDYALLRSFVNLICLIALLAYAFNGKQTAGWFWRPLFLARIATDFIGHNYELQFFKSSFHGDRLAFTATLVFYGLLLIPFYFAHYVYAFRKAKKDAPSSIVLAAG